MMRLTICLLLVMCSFGSDTPSNFTLNVVNFRGNPVTDFSRGQYVQLRAESGGDGGNLGIRVIGCDVIGTPSNVRREVITAGCGDGDIFRKDAGFTTVDRVSKSPDFRAFSLKGDLQIRFECRFIICATPCDGSSCTNEQPPSGSIAIVSSPSLTT